MASVLSPTPLDATGGAEDPTKNIKISSDHAKSMYYFSDLTARFLESEQSINISGLGKAVSKVVSTIEHLKSKDVIVVKKIHTGLNTNVELVITVEKGPGHAEYLQSMEDRKGKTD